MEDVRPEAWSSRVRQGLIRDLLPDALTQARIGIGVEADDPFVRLESGGALWAGVDPLHRGGVPWPHHLEELLDVALRDRVTPGTRHVPSVDDCYALVDREGVDQVLEPKRESTGVALWVM